jgi:hypothetical protein
LLSAQRPIRRFDHSRKVLCSCYNDTEQRPSARTAAVRAFAVVMGTDHGRVGCSAYDCQKNIVDEVNSSADIRTLIATVLVRRRIFRRFERRTEWYTGWELHANCDRSFRLRKRIDVFGFDGGISVAHRVRFMSAPALILEPRKPTYLKLR